MLTDSVGNIVGAVGKGHGAGREHLQVLEDLLGLGVKHCAPRHHTWTRGQGAQAVCAHAARVASCSMPGAGHGRRCVTPSPAAPPRAGSPSAAACMAAIFGSVSTAPWTSWVTPCRAAFLICGTAYGAHTHVRSELTLFMQQACCALVDLMKSNKAKRAYYYIATAHMIGRLLHANPALPCSHATGPCGTNQGAPSPPQPPHPPSCRQPPPAAWRHTAAQQGLHMCVYSWERCVGQGRWYHVLRRVGQGRWYHVFNLWGGGI